MSTTIKTNCERCGDLDLTPEDVTVLIDLGEHNDKYQFECTTCGYTIDKPANEQVSAVLLASGCNYKAFNRSPIDEEEVQAFTRTLDTL